VSDTIDPFEAAFHGPAYTPPHELARRPYAWRKRYTRADRNHRRWGIVAVVMLFVMALAFLSLITA
jgi:hypothetical protein